MGHIQKSIVKLSSNMEFFISLSHPCISNCIKLLFFFIASKWSMFFDWLLIFSSLVSKIFNTSEPQSIFQSSWIDKTPVIVFFQFRKQRIEVLAFQIHDQDVIVWYSDVIFVLFVLLIILFTFSSSKMDTGLQLFLLQCFDLICLSAKVFIHLGQVKTLIPEHVFS